MQQSNLSYRNAGVDVDAGNRAVDLIKEYVKKTHIPGVVSDLGGFGGAFSPDLTAYPNPVFLSGKGGGGTKVRIGFVVDRHDTVGIDCVAMCANDIVCCGATPLFFLDYIAMGKNVPERTASIVKGVAEGCIQAGCALIGGEMGEHPGVLRDDEYDLAGFVVGVVDRSNLLDGSIPAEGDALIALPSSGLHSNGFSLVRRIIDKNSLSLGNTYGDLGCVLGEELLKPTRIYVKTILKLMEHGLVLGAAHITGGGIYENVPRAYSGQLTARIERTKIPTQPIFGFIQSEGGIPDADMFSTFNMGVGMVLVVSASRCDEALRILDSTGEKAIHIGELVSGDKEVQLV